MGYKSGIQLLVATLLVFLIKYTHVFGQENHKNGNIGAILKFWEPDPKFQNMTAASTRRLKPIKQNKESQYRRRKQEPDPNIDNITEASRRHLWTMKPNQTSEYRSNNQTSKIQVVLVQNEEGRDASVLYYRVSKRAGPAESSDKLTKTSSELDEVTTKVVAVVPEIAPVLTTLGIAATPEILETPEIQQGQEAGNKQAEDETMNDEVFILSVYEIVDQFNKIFKDVPDLNVSSEVLGRTASYNDIVLFKISKKSPKNSTSYFRADDDKYIEEAPEKKIIFIVHALSSMGLKYLYNLTVEKHLRKLLSFYFRHLDHFDIFLLPMANPDGYVQSKLSDIWNKNVSPQPACAGVAVDRNFDVAWNISRKISSCSQQYPGEYPFSEPESQAVKSIFHQFSHKIIAYFHVHSATYDARTFKGDAVLYPRGFAESQSDDDRYLDLRGEIDEAIKNANFKTLSVTVDTLLNWYGKVAGTSVDYAATVYGVPYAMELVMQAYQNPHNDKLLGSDYELESHAVKEIWGRLIDIIFTNIWKKITAVAERRR